MNRRNYIVNLFLKKTIPVLMALMVGILMLQHILPFFSLRFGTAVIQGAEERIPSLFAFVWKENYPARQSYQTAGERQDKLPWMLEVILEQIPAYRYHHSTQNQVAVADNDPAYGEYLENQAFYQEYEYLLREYGHDGAEGENTMDGQQGSQLAAADPGVTGGSGTSGDDAPLTQTTSTTVLPGKSSLPVIGSVYVREQLADYDFMMKHFYSVHSSTTAGRDLMKAEDFLDQDFSLQGGNDKPQILIYHTHSQEEFADYGPDNREATIVHVGNYLTELLQAKGYNVIHDTNVYDLHDGKLDRNKAYTYALEGISGILQANPSIEVVLDVHRDGVKEGLHLVNQVNGKDTAPIMFFNGMSQTPEGPIEYLQNPYRKENLAFSFQMQLNAEAYFPDFTRKIYLKGLRYNMHLRPRSALIEVGAQTNTFAEAKNAMEPLSELLDMVLQSK